MASIDFINSQNTVCRVISSYVYTLKMKIQLRVTLETLISSHTYKKRMRNFVDQSLYLLGKECIVFDKSWKLLEHVLYQGCRKLFLWCGKGWVKTSATMIDQKQKILKLHVLKHSQKAEFGLKNQLFKTSLDFIF